jgi:hypothetical protein
MNAKAFHISSTLLVATICLSLLACGGGSSGNSASATQNGDVNMVLSDDPTQDWATIGIKVLSVTLTPQGGGTPLAIYAAPSSGVPSINLVQLDQLGEIIGNAQIAPGTYSQATITVSGNPSDITLTSAPDPEPGFPLQTVTAVPSSQIQVVGATGSPLAVPVIVNLSPMLTVTANSSNTLDLEFDLSHPAFIVQHVSPAGTFWAVNFNPAVRHHPIRDITKLVLRRTYGTVPSVSSDNTSITISKILPTVPAVTPETYNTTTLSLTIMADSTNGTIFRDLDAGTRNVITNFSSVGGTLPSKFVRIQVRYQQNGTLVATRIWTSTSFAKVYVSGEGHVLDVNASAGTFTVVNEDGTTSTITVDSNTQFFFQNGTTAIGQRTSFLGAPNFMRGFKVLYNLQDDSVIIEIARFSGLISGANTTGFKYTRTFGTGHTSDNYAVTLDYISSSTANGEDNSGNAINGFKWWYFAQPTGTLDYGANSISQFVSVANATGVNYGGSLGTQTVAGESYATWNDPANPNNAWSAQWALLLPTPAPLSKVTTAASAITGGATFGMTPQTTTLFTGPFSPVTVDLSSQSGQATLVYQVSLSNGVVSITPLDIAQQSNLNTLVSQLGNGALVKVYGVPGNANLNAYVLFYFAGIQPTQ